MGHSKLKARAPGGASSNRAKTAKMTAGERLMGLASLASILSILGEIVNEFKVQSSGGHWVKNFDL